MLPLPRPALAPASRSGEAWSRRTFSLLEFLMIHADVRRDAAQAWVASELRKKSSAAPFSFTPASADASFRRYWRATLADGRTYVVMDAPPEREDCRPFVRVARMLHEAGVNAPQVLAQDLGQGFLLLTDLG